MPLYEYECIKNGHRFEVIQKFSDPPVEVCAHCKSRVRKVLSAPAISFKGSGWYVTDYPRSGSNGSGRAAESKPEPVSSGAKAAAASKGGDSKGSASSD